MGVSQRFPLSEKDISYGQILKISSVSEKWTKNVFAIFFSILGETCGLYWFTPTPHAFYLVKWKKELFLFNKASFKNYNTLILEFFKAFQQNLEIYTSLITN